MISTPLSLLERIARGSDPAAWRQVHDLYAPLIGGWLRQARVPSADAEDLSQDVLAVLVRELPHFRHNRRPGAFRRWLRVMTVHRVKHFWRTRTNAPALADLDRLANPDDELGRRWEEEHDQHVLTQLLNAIQPEFQPNTWNAFRRLVIDGTDPEQVAKELGISTNAVYIAKSRVLQRLHQEAAGLIG